MSKRHQGFTLLELLVVIGILLVLAGMLFMGMRSLDASGRKNQTKVTLQNLRSMTEEYKLAAGLTTIAGNMPSPQLVANIGGGTATDRTGTAVAMSRSVMARMLAVTINQKVMSGIPDSTKFNESVTPPTSAIVWSSGTNYTQLTVVHYPAIADPVYICISDHLSNLSTAPGTAKAPWFLVDVTKPILKDAWDNPIIFVSGGLTAPTYDNTKDYYPGEAVAYSGSFFKAKTHVVGVSPSIGPSWDAYSGPALPMKSPDGKPFWASAGPDGDFAQFDDNLYSFEN